MSLRICLLVAGLLGAAGPAPAQELRLPNGALLVVEPRPTSETVALRLVIRGGDLDSAGKQGVSHLHAALLLRGTKEKDAFALARAAEELGGRLTATSVPLAEIVSMTVPIESSDAALRLIVETLLSPRLEADDLEKEKNLWISELATERDEPSTQRRDEVYRAVFPGHPLSRLSLPSVKEIRAVRVEDIREFHRSRLEGARLALFVVGSCDVSRITPLAGEVLGRVPSGPGAGSRLETPFLPHPAPLADDVERHVSRRTTQPEMTIALATDGISDAEQPAFALLSHILGGFEERLYREIREKRGWAYSIDAGGQNFPGAGLFEVTMGARKGHFDDIERIVRSELASIASVAVSPEELLRAVRYLKTAEARRDETNAGRASVLIDELLAGSLLRTYEERIARLAAVKPEEIRALAHRLFAGKHVVVVTMY